MRDKRPVDELSIEELERILAIRKREARQNRLRRLDEEGRRQRPQESPAPQTPAAVPAAPTSQSTAQDAPSPERALDLPMPADPGNELPVFVPDDGPFHGNSFGTSAQPGTDPAQRRAGKMIWNRTLMLVEVVAFIGLIIIGAELFQALQQLQSETAAVQAEAQAIAYASLPTPTVTPEISLNRIVLPSGHTPPTSAGGAQFNLNEIPANLRPVVQRQLSAPISIPTPGPESPVRVRIPAINVDAPVVSGTDWEALKRGVGHQPNTGMPGQPGNLVLSAHNDIYSEIFRYLDQLAPGDEIIVHTLTRTYTYVVRESQVVSPYAVHVMDPTRDPTVTLISCYPYQVDNQRIVVFADMIQS